jgi:hypothetical protein
MNEAKARFLFGDVDPGLDLEDPDVRRELLRRELPDSGHTVLAEGIRDALVTQVLEEDPPQTWATARRLLAAGVDRRAALTQLGLALLAHLRRLLDRDEGFDAAGYAAALDALPLPTPEEVAAAYVRVVRERQPMLPAEADAAVRAALGRERAEAEVDLLTAVAEQVLDGLLAGGGLLALADERLVHPASLCDGIVLTHRLTAPEVAADRLSLEFDLHAFLVADAGYVNDALDGEYGRPLTRPAGGGAVWLGPEGWLSSYAPGDLLAVRLAETAGPTGVTVTLTALPAEPDPGDLVPALRAAYDAESDGLPVSAAELVFRLLADDRGRLRSPAPPLTQLCAVAGLHVRGSRVALDEPTWRRERMTRRAIRLLGTGRDEQEWDALLSCLAVLDDPGADRAALGEALATMRDERMLARIAVEVFDSPDYDDAGGGEGDRADIADRLLAAARRPVDRAIAAWFAAVAAERRGDLPAAEAYLVAALDADPRFAAGLDRLAWYRSDRGDAAGAARLWRRLGTLPEESAELAVVEGYAAPDGPRLRRNQACWCGSGRKFKVCHLGRPREAALPDRVEWLLTKMGSYLRRRGGPVAEDLSDLAWARLGRLDGRPPALKEFPGAFDDGLVADVALHEMGWLESFLADRGPLLPEDELLLAQSWQLVPRTVYEVVAVAPGTSVDVRDLRTGDRLTVRERTLGRSVRPGQLLCGRAVPDRQSRQFAGGLVPVPAGRERDLLALLDEEDGEAFLAWVGRFERPPTVTTRDGEPLVTCRAAVRVPAPAAAREVLDRLYEPEPPDTWRELHRLSGVDNVLRATLRLAGDLLTVDTMSEPRMDRVLDRLTAELPGTRVVTDDRGPTGPGAGLLAGLPGPDPLSAGPGPDDPELSAALDEWMREQELRWCDEPVPALAGLTPRQAADDPTRREELERLLVSFDRLEPPAGMIGMQPGRLRRLLALVR